MVTSLKANHLDLRISFTISMMNDRYLEYYSNQLRNKVKYTPVTSFIYYKKILKKKEIHQQCFEAWITAQKNVRKFASNGEII